MDIEYRGLYKHRETICRGITFVFLLPASCVFFHILYTDIRILYFPQVCVCLCSKIFYGQGILECFGFLDNVKESFRENLFKIYVAG